jgi:hypothetical protein
MAQSWPMRSSIAARWSSGGELRIPLDAQGKRAATGCAERCAGVSGSCESLVRGHVLCYAEGSLGRVDECANRQMQEAWE